MILRMGALQAALVRPLHALALATGASARWAQRRPVLRIVMLHGVGPEELPVEAFTAQAAWLARHFRVVPLADLLAKAAGQGAPERDVALTFDDGLACHADVVAPLLARLGLPATFFVCPGLIESRRWLWNHEARRRLGLLSAAERASLAAAAGGPGPDVEQLVGWLKALPLAAREAAEQRLRAATPGFAPTPAERARFDPLTWQQLAQLDPALITVGSHTLTHPILTTLDDAALEHELAGSRALLEQRLGRPVDLFCYPNGSQDPRVRAAAARVYRAAVTTESGCARPGGDLFALPRIAVAERLSLLAWRMHRPAA